MKLQLFIFFILFFFVTVQAASRNPVSNSVESPEDPISVESVEPSIEVASVESEEVSLNRKTSGIN